MSGIEALALFAPLPILLAAIWWMDYRMTGLRGLMAERVIVHIEGAAVRGALVASYRDAIVLEDASYLAADGEERLGPRVTIPRERIRWIERAP